MNKLTISFFLLIWTSPFLVKSQVLSANNRLRAVEEELKDDIHDGNPMLRISSQDKGYETTDYTVVKKYEEKDGFQWSLVKNGELYGAINRFGNLLIPVEFTAIEYNYDANVNTHYFTVNKGQIEGAYTRGAKSICYVLGLLFTEANIPKSQQEFDLVPQKENVIEEAELQDDLLDNDIQEDNTII